MSTIVLSVGGSIINPGEPNVKFLGEFRTRIIEWLQENPDERLVLVAGGGAPARVYQQALKDVMGTLGEDIDYLDIIARGQDWLGIMATRINAQLLAEIFSGLCLDPVVTDPTDDIICHGRILVASGYEPGYSSDNVAVMLAKALDADTVVNLSNIKQVYTDDPNKNPEAKPIDSITWPEFRNMVGNEWTPGMNVPFDPIASKLAEESGIRVVCAKGTNIENTMAILEDRDFVGTVIHPVAS